MPHADSSKIAPQLPSHGSVPAYVHYDYWPLIIHHDISSTNVLDQEYEAHIFDLDTARLSKSNSSNWSHWTSLAGTFVYMAPS